MLPAVYRRIYYLFQMTNDELLALPDTKLKSLLLSHWNLNDFDSIEFTGFFKPKNGLLGELEDLCLVAPTDLPEPFRYSLPFQQRIKPVFHHATSDATKQPMQAGQAYRFFVRLSEPTKGPRKNPFDLVSYNVRPCTEPEYQRRIDELFRVGNSGPKSNQRKLAAALEQMGGSMYLEPNRFLFELLQNADDYPDPYYDNKVRVNLRLLKDYILFQHNGLAFQYRNVESLADVGNSTKTDERETTGYKGIGFKSVFGASKWVYVRSNKYSFRFSYEGNSFEPWHTWPRWTNEKELPDPLASDRHFLDERRYPVSFALRIDSARVGGNAGYSAVLRDLLARPQFALFLRHLNQLSIEGVDLPTTRLRRTLDTRTGKTTFQVGEQVDVYSVSSYEIDARVKLAELIKSGVAAEKSFPEKLRDAHTIKLWFAARFNQEGGLEALASEQAPLFSYLPTNDTAYGLHLLVNADFILAPNRVQIQSHHQWNEFLFRQIGLHLIQWIADRIKEDATNAQEIYAFVPAAQNANPNQEALNAGIQEGIETISFLPSADTNQLLQVSEAVLDKPGLYKLLPNLYRGLLNNELAVIQAGAKLSVEAAKLIERFGLKYIDWNKLKQIFSHDDVAKFYQPTDATRLLQYFATDSSIVASDWQAVRWLFDHRDRLVAPNEAGVYGLLAEKWDPNFPLATEVCYLHLDLQQVIRANEVVATWVEKDLKLAPYCRQQVVSDLLIAAVCNSATDNSVTDQGIQYLYHLYRRQELQKWLPESDTYRKKLAKARVLCVDKKYYSIGNSFLSQHYAPVFALENVVEELGENEFPLISAAYLEVFNEPAGWRSFWQFCEVGDPNAATILREKLVPQLTKVSSWSASKHETVLRLALDAYCHAQAGVLGFKLNVLGKLKALTAEGIESNPVELANCHLPRAYNPALALLDGLVDEYLPSTRLSDSYFQDYPAEAAARFFQETGCQVWTEAQLVEQYLTSALIEPKQLGAAENLLHTQRLQQWHNRGLLSAAVLVKLRKWPLLLKSGETSVAITCYLATEYQPELDLEALTGAESQQFVSGNYLPAFPALEEVTAWRQFLLAIKVKETFEISYQGKLTRSGPSFSLKRYFDYIDKQGLYETKFAASRHEGKHSLQRFVFISSLDLVTSAVAARLLCEAIQVFEAKLTVFEPPLYSPNGGVATVPVPSMLSVYPVVLCTDGELRCANEVFSAQLERVPTGRPVAALSYGSLNYERVLGLRIQLAPGDALQVLVQSLPSGAMSGAEASYTMRNRLSAKLYELLPDLAVLRQPDPEWAKRVLLPAANNTWVPVAGAYFIPNEEYINSASGIVLKAMPGLDSELYQQFCIALGAVLVESKDFEDEDATDQSTDWSARFQSRLASCHVLELLAHIGGEAPEQIDTWRERSNELRFLQVAALRRKSKTIADYTIPTNDNNSIADGTFWFVGSLFRGHWSRLATFLVRELQLPRSIRLFLIANLLESRELGEQVDVLRTQNITVPAWLLPATVAPETTPVSIAITEAVLKKNSPSSEPSIGSNTEQVGTDNELSEEKSITPEERKTIHEQACKAAITWLLAHSYGLPTGIEEQFSVLNQVHSPEGQHIKVVVRSALKGRLFFHVYEWSELCEPGTLLLLFCRQAGADPYIVPVTNPAEQLVLANPNTYVRVPNPPLNATVLAALAADTYNHSPDFRYVFLHLPGSGAPSINLAHRQVEDILSADTSFPI
jgi:hypothetical protein